MLLQGVIGVFFSVDCFAEYMHFQAFLASAFFGRTTLMKKFFFAAFACLALFTMVSSAGDFIIGTFVADASGIQTFSMNATLGVNQPQDQFIIGETMDIPSNDPPGTDRAGTVQINALQLRNISAADCILADVSGSGIVDFNDIPFFVDILLNP